MPSSFPDDCLAYPGRIIFDHIPKTAGVAISSWLRDALGQGCVSPNSICEHWEAIGKYGGFFSIVSGHIFFHDGDALDPRYHYVTVLREPIDRAVSWIFFLLHNTPAGLSRELVDGVRAFVATDGAICEGEFLASLSNYCVEHFSKIGTTGLSSPSQKLQAAQRTLKSYRIVGFYEEMDAFLHQMAHLIGMKSVPSFNVVNRTTDRPKVRDLAPQLLAKLQDLTRLDAELYTWARGELARVGQSRYSLDQSADPGRDWDRYQGRNLRSLASEPVVIEGARVESSNSIPFGEQARFLVDILVSKPTNDIVIGIEIFDADGRWTFGTNTELLGTMLKGPVEGRLKAMFEIVLNLPSGQYSAGFAVVKRSGNGIYKSLAWRRQLCHFVVSDAPPHGGYLYLASRFSLVGSADQSMPEMSGRATKLTRADVVWAYRLLLDRDPESDEVVDGYLAHCTSRRDLVGLITGSPEYQRTDAGSQGAAGRG